MKDGQRGRETSESRASGAAIMNACDGCDPFHSAVMCKKKCLYLLKIFCLNYTRPHGVCFFAVVDIMGRRPNEY